LDGGKSEVSALREGFIATRAFQIVWLYDGGVEGRAAVGHPINDVFSRNSDHAFISSHRGIDVCSENA
jgi:hypothetical protein